MESVQEQRFINAKEEWLMKRTGRVTLNLKEAEKFSLLDRVAFLIALILPAGLHAAASVHLLTCCCSECLPDRLHGVGGEDKVTMNIRSFNSWPGALRALAAKQFKLSPKHPFGGSETLAHSQRVCLQESTWASLQGLETDGDTSGMHQKAALSPRTGIPVRVGVEELSSHWHWSEAACVGMSEGSRPGPSILPTPEKPGQAGSALQRGCALRITNFVPQKAVLSLSAVDGRSIRNQGTSLVFTIHYKHFRYFFQTYIWGQGI